MPCYHPVQCGRSKRADPSTGKHTLVHRSRFPHLYDTISRPCGQCRGCRHDIARQWTARCMHEAQLHEVNSFITLTFNDAHLGNGSLEKDLFPLFMKRLRKHYSTKIWSRKLKIWVPRKKTIEPGIRFYHCGEYGEQFSRPHHHSILFNISFPDLYAQQLEDRIIMRSPTLEQLWSDPDTGESYGYSSVDKFSYENAAYVARYVLKKINGALAPDHYQGRQPEYTTMSRRPGIAANWYEKYKDTDVFPRDYVVLNGHKQKVPKYYDKKYELTNPEDFLKLKNIRMQKAKTNPNNNLDCLAAAEQIQKAYDLRKKRSYESN